VQLDVVRGRKRPRDGVKIEVDLGCVFEQLRAGLADDRVCEPHTFKGCSARRERPD